MAGSPLLAIASMLSQIPGQAQAANIQKQQAQAAMEQQKSQAEQQAFLLKAQKTQFAQQQYKDVATKAHNDPKLAASNIPSAQAAQIQQETGIPATWTIGDDGVKRFDHQAYLDRPGVNFDTMDPKDRLTGQTLTPEARQQAYPDLYSDSNPEAAKAWLTGKQQQPPATEQYVAMAHTHLDKLTEDLSLGRITPSVFVQDIKNSAEMWQNAGITGWQSYLNPNNDFLRQPLAAYAQTQVNKVKLIADTMRDNRGFKVDELKLRELYLQHAFQEAGIHDAQRDQSNSIAEARLQIDQQRAQNEARLAGVQYQNIQSMIKARGQNTDLRRNTLYWNHTQTQLKNTTATMGAAIGHLQKIVSDAQANNIAPDPAVLDALNPNPGLDANGMPISNIMTQYMDLLNETQADQARADAQSDADAASKLGHPVRSVPTQPATAANPGATYKPINPKNAKRTGKDSQGKPVYDMGDGKAVHADGSPAQ